MALKKPSDIFNKTEPSGVFNISEVSSNITETYDRFRDNLDKVNVLSEQIEQLSQQLSEKMTRTDLENAMYSQLMILDENFKSIQNQVRGLNKEDLKEFKVNVSNLSEIVGNLVENEIPKYKRQITNNEVRIGDKFDQLKEVVEENIVGIRNEIDVKVNDIAEVIDTNLEYFNNQLQETSSEVKKTSDTYNKLSKIVESKVSKENEKLEEYSQVIQSLHEAFIELEKSFQEETSTYNQIIEEKFANISSDVKSTIHSIDENVNNKINSIDEDVDTFKNQVSSDISSIKADVVIFEKHNKDTEKTIQEFSEQLYKISEIDTNIIIINEDIGKLQNQYDSVSNQSIETKKDLEVVERYIQNHHRELVELKEEVFGEIEQIPVGNLQENLERLEKKIDYIKETYSKIEPEVIVKEVIKEGLLNEPPDTKNSDPLTPLDQKFVTLDQLQKHYSLFINRIQQQLSTLGGGGETRLKYLDDIVGIATNASAYDGKYLKYNHSLGKFEFTDVDIINDSWIEGDLGPYTLGSVGIGTTNPTSKLHVVGDVRVTGVVTATTFVGALTGTATSTTNIPNLTGAITSNNTTTSLGSFSSANLATALTDETGSGANVFAISPVLVTPSLGAATATSINASGIITATQLSTGASGTGVNITTDTISGPATLTIDPAAVGDNTGAVRIKGDLYVDGTQFIVNSTTIELADFNVGIATTVGTNALLDGAGIGIGSTSIRKTLTWSNSSTALKSSEDFDVASGKVYKIAGTSVLSNNTLGSGVVNSSLTSVGTLGQLQVTGVSTFTNGPILIGTATSTGTASQPLQVTGGAYVSGSVGIGTILPSYKLDVLGQARVAGDFHISGGSVIDGVGQDLFLQGNSGYGIIFRTNGANERGRFNSTGNLLIATTSDTGTSSQRLQVTGGAYVSGNLGIGTTNPTSKLDIIGDVKVLGVSTFTNANNAAIQIRSGATGSYATFNIGRTAAEVSFAVAGAGAQFAIDAAAGDVVIRTESAAAKLLFTNGGTNSTLAVAGNNVLVGTVSSTGTASQPLQVTGGAYVSGSVGIGTISPARPLHVNGTVRIADSAALEWGGTSAYIAGTSASNALLFNTSSVERVRIDSSGSVGIGTNNPKATLQVKDALAFETTNTTTSSTSQVAVDTFATATFRSAKYQVQMTCPGQIATLGGITTGGSGYTAGTFNVTFSNSSGTGAAAQGTLTISNGTVSQIGLGTTGGSGYTAGDVLTAAGGSGLQVSVASTASPSGRILTLGAITSAGIGYTAGVGVGTTTLTFLGGTGTGAVGLATIFDGVITSATLLQQPTTGTGGTVFYSGSNYTTSTVLTIAKTDVTNTITTITGSVGVSTFTSFTAHGIGVSDTVRVSSTSNGLTAGTNYFVVTTPTPTTFTLGTTIGVGITFTTGSSLSIGFYRNSANAGGSVAYLNAITGISTNFQVSDLLVLQNGTTADFVEYGTIANNDILGTFAADISGANARLLVTPTYATNTVKVARQAITV